MQSSSTTFYCKFYNFCGVSKQKCLNKCSIYIFKVPLKYVLSFTVIGNHFKAVNKCFDRYFEDWEMSAQMQNDEFMSVNEKPKNLAENKSRSKCF